MRQIEAICTLRSRYRGKRRALLVWLSLRANRVIEWITSANVIASGGRWCPCTYVVKVLIIKMQMSERFVVDIITIYNFF